MDGSIDMQNPVIIFQELKNLQEIQFGGRFFLAHSVNTYTIQYTSTISSLITSPSYQPAAIPEFLLW